MGAKAPLPQMKDKAMFAVRYYTKPVENKMKSAEKAVPVFEDILFCEMIKDGNKHMEFRATEDFINQHHNVRRIGATDVDRLIAQKHKDAYEAYKKDEEAPVRGYPLAEWSALPRTVMESFKKLQVRTIEELALAEDLLIEKYGAEGKRYRSMAQAFLEEQKDEKKAFAKVAALEAELKDLKELLKDKDEQIKKLDKQITKERKNA